MSLEKDPENDFLYSVLNLNKGASQAEINERHRALSLIFHPDKQHNEESKVVATEKFLEIQKAYQVLSDTFLREVYDTLGEEGLTLRWSPEIRSKSREEIRRILAQLNEDIQYKELNEQILPKGSLTCGVDATSLFGPYVGSANDSLPRRILNRFEDVKLLKFQLRHSTKKKLSAESKFSFESRIQHNPIATDCALLGTIRHQFSPRFTSEVMISLLQPHFLTLGGTYHENGNTVTMRVSCAPAAFHSVPPSLALSASRKLFRKRLETASLELYVGKQPRISINFLFPTIFGLRSLDSPPPGNSVPPSYSGLGIGTTHKSFGLTFESIVPKLVGEWGVTFSELALRLKVGAVLGFSGIQYLCSGSWSNHTTEIITSAHFDPTGILLQLESVDFFPLQDE